MPIKQKIDIQLLVPGFDWSLPIGLVKKGKDLKTREIILPDGQYERLSGKIKLRLVEDKTSLLSYIIYAEAIIVNETPFKFDYFNYVKHGTNSDYEDMLAGCTPSNPDSDFLRYNENITLVSTVGQNICVQFNKKFVGKNFRGYKLVKNDKGFSVRMLGTSEFSLGLEGANLGLRDYNKNIPHKALIYDRDYDLKVFEFGL